MKGMVYYSKATDLLYLKSFATEPFKPFMKVISELRNAGERQGSSILAKDHKKCTTKSPEL